MVYIADYIWSVLATMMMATNAYSLKKIKVKPHISNVFLAVANAFFSFTISFYFFEHQVPVYKIYWIIAGFIFLLIAMGFLKTVQNRYLK